MILHPYGERAILVEVDDRDRRRGLDAALRTNPPAHLLDHVAADRTVLVRARAADHLPRLADELRAIQVASLPADAVDTDVRDIEVIYDGEDLEDVAGRLDISPAEVARRHSSQLWTVEFSGFLPGFGYLTGSDDNLFVPRRDSPRTRIPRGALALAGHYTGIYPTGSPGGWQLIGHTDEVMFDPHRDPAAILVPGARIRFVARETRHGPP